jgi:hypothetical protein
MGFWLGLGVALGCVVLRYLILMHGVTCGLVSHTYCCDKTAAMRGLFHTHIARYLPYVCKGPREEVMYML